MKKLYYLAGFCLSYISAQSQSITVNELINLTNYSIAKFENVISKKGYKPQAREAQSVIFSQPETFGQESAVTKSITKYKNGENSSLSFDRLTKKEWEELKDNLVAEGFSCEYEDTPDAEMIYQKKSYTVSVSREDSSADGEEFYNVSIETKHLPKAKEIIYAEDLLPLDSHKYIAAVYGERNVVKDVFITADGKRKACSVLFPNSTAEAVFLWEDGTNYRTLHSIRVGGLPYTESSIGYERPVLQNKWFSTQGIYPGMSLHELDNLNGTEISFYGWDWNRGGSLAEGNKGSIDFKKISLVLSCFNCTDRAYSGKKVNTSKTALEENKKIHVSTIVLFPSKG